MNIQPANVDDLPALLELQKLAFQSEAELYPETEIAPMRQTLPELVQEFAHYTTLIAEQGGELVGSVRGQVVNGRGEIGRLMVQPARRGQGLGRRLMREIETALDVQTFRLFTGECSLSNLRLYESLGYIQSGQFEAGSIGMVELTKSGERKMTQPASVPPTTHILIIDNYDSFTYNLVQYFGELGCELTVWRNDAFTLEDVENLNPDAIVVSPGPCTPLEAGLSVDVIRAFAPKYPLLGVCLGHQSIGEAFGATVKRAPIPVHGKTSRVSHDGQHLFAGIEGDASVTRYHSLIVEDLPPELVATAWTTDQTPLGEYRALMALRHRDYPVFGVQFHPESIATEGGKTMIRNFLNEVRQHQAPRA